MRIYLCKYFLKIEIECIDNYNQNGFSIFVDELAASSINMGFRVWVSTADYWTVRWDVLETIIYRFREENINIPFDQLDITIRKEQEELL